MIKQKHLLYGAILFIVLFFALAGKIFSQDIQFERTIQTDGFSDKEFQRVKNLVGKAERFRGSDIKDFSYVFEVNELVKKVSKSTNSIKVNVANDTKNNKRSSLVEIITGSSKGNLILQKGVNMWFYKPGTSNALRISPTQRLLGGASYSDVSATNYTFFYDPIGIEEVSIGKIKAYKITLGQIVKGVAYNKVDFYIDTLTSKPIKSEFFTRSGRLIKTMFFRKYKTIKGFGTITSEWVIADALRPSLVTIISIKNMKYESINKNRFTTEGLIE